MGTLRQRKGKWFVDIIVGGRRYRKVIGKSKHLADIALKELELKAAKNELGFLDQKEITLQDFLKEYEQFSSANHRPQTQARYKAVAQHFLGFLLSREPNMRFLKRVKLDHIEKYKIYRRSQEVPRNGYYKGLAKGMKARRGAKAHTVNFELTALRTMFYFGVRMGYLDSNPAKGITLLKTDDAKQRRFLSEEECKALLQAMPPELYPIFFTFLNTGMRRAELVNLEWTDVDLVRRVIKIQRKSFWLPKTGEREIPINDGLFGVLDNLPRKGNFVFTDKDGTQMDINKVRRLLIGIAKKAGIEDLTEVHALRHSFCSQLLMKGVDLPSVQKLMGHNRIETTMLYTHQTTEHLRNAISKLNFDNIQKTQ